MEKNGAARLTRERELAVPRNPPCGRCYRKHVLGDADHPQHPCGCAASDPGDRSSGTRSSSRTHDNAVRRVFNRRDHAYTVGALPCTLMPATPATCSVVARGHRSGIRASGRKRRLGPTIPQREACTGHSQSDIAAHQNLNESLEWCLGPPEGGRSDSGHAAVQGTSTFIAQKCRYVMEPASRAALIIHHRPEGRSGRRGLLPALTHVAAYRDPLPSDLNHLVNVISLDLAKVTGQEPVALEPANRDYACRTGLCGRNGGARSSSCVGQLDELLSRSINVAPLGVFDQPLR